MNNEPVAWGWYDLEIKRFFPHWDEDLMENKEGCIPLYTHPAKTPTLVLDGNRVYPTVKELTDEEITACIDESEPDTADMIRFAKAILRKAQEK
jgi:hypothetical protein